MERGKRACCCVLDDVLDGGFPMFRSMQDVVGSKVSTHARLQVRVRSRRGPLRPITRSAQGTFASTRQSSSVTSAAAPCCFVVCMDQSKHSWPAFESRFSEGGSPCISPPLPPSERQRPWLDSPRVSSSVVRSAALTAIRQHAMVANFALFTPFGADMNLTRLIRFQWKLFASLPARSRRFGRSKYSRLGNWHASSAVGLRSDSQGGSTKVKRVRMRVHMRVHMRMDEAVLRGEALHAVLHEVLHAVLGELRRAQRPRCLAKKHRAERSARDRCMTAAMRVSMEQGIREKDIREQDIRAEAHATARRNCTSTR